MDWKYIDDIVITDNTQQIHCDTRDFCCKLYEFKLDCIVHADLSKIAYKEEHLIKTENIIPFLKQLETISGGKGNWRILQFKDLEDVSGWDCKYIRFYRIDDNWIVCNRDANPIEAIISESKDILFGKGKSNYEKAIEVFTILHISYKSIDGAFDVVSNILFNNFKKI